MSTKATRQVPKEKYIQSMDMVNTTGKKTTQ